MTDLTNSYFNEQIITYIGNKRTLLKEIRPFVEYVASLVGGAIVTADLFSGSGVVARLLKQYSSLVIANDLEEYSELLNKTYLDNASNFDIEIYRQSFSALQKAMEFPVEGIITKMYAPKDDNNIRPGERVFYTHDNAVTIDSYRYYIERIVPSAYRKYFLSSLITEASVHVNTSGVFKGFYKDKHTGIGKFGGTAENALGRIKGKIAIKTPVFSPKESDFMVFREDALALSAKLQECDLVYLDPPYNQHPYGSNYFMLNLILNNEMPHRISSVSGIPADWNHSAFNSNSKALYSLEKVVSRLNAKFILVSYNNEGFISYEEMVNKKKKYGKVFTRKIDYNVFRGGRNLRERPIHTNEFLFLLKK